MNNQLSEDARILVNKLLTTNRNWDSEMIPTLSGSAKTAREVVNYLVLNGFANNAPNSHSIIRLSDPKGRRLKALGNIEAYWDEEDRIKNESKHTSHYGDKITVNANDIIGSAIGRHASLRGSNPIKEATITETAKISIPEPTVNSRGWLKKLMWWIFGCIVSFGVGVAVYFYTKGK